MKVKVSGFDVHLEPLISRLFSDKETSNRRFLVFFFEQTERTRVRLSFDENIIVLIKEQNKRSKTVFDDCKFIRRPLALLAPYRG